MKKLIFTLALGLTSAHAAAQDSKWSVTFDGVYAKPFGSKGYSGRLADGYGFSAALESRYQPWLGLGLNAHGLGFRQSGDQSAFSGLGLFARWIPIRDPHFEPYALLGLGADYAASADDPALKRQPGVVLSGGMGTLIPLQGCLAIDLGLDYVSRPGGEQLQNVQGRLGLQMRFGQSRSLGQAPRAEASELQTLSLAKGKAKAAATTTTTTVSASTAAVAAEDKRYLIKRGDNLWRIAAQDSVYGNPYKYKKLVEANPELIKDPNLIYPDTKLVLP